MTKNQGSSVQLGPQAPKAVAANLIDVNFGNQIVEKPALFICPFSSVDQSSGFLPHVSGVQVSQRVPFIRVVPKSGQSQKYWKPWLSQYKQVINRRQRSITSATRQYTPLAQLDRAPDYGSGSKGSSPLWRTRLLWNADSLITTGGERLVNRLW